MAEDRRADRPGEETHGVHTERLQRADEWIGPRKIKPGKHQAGYGAVQEEVVPLDRRSDRASQNRTAQLPPLLCFVDGAGLVTGSHLVSVGGNRPCPSGTR